MQNEQTFTPEDEFIVLWDNGNELILIDEPSSEFLMQCLSELKRCLEDGFPSDEHPPPEKIQDAINQLHEEHKKFAIARHEQHVYPEPEEPPDVDEHDPEADGYIEPYATEPEDKV